MHQAARSTRTVARLVSLGAVRGGAMRRVQATSRECDDFGINHLGPVSPGPAARAPAERADTIAHEALVNMPRRQRSLALVLGLLVATSWSAIGASASAVPPLPALPKFAGAPHAPGSRLSEDLAGSTTPATAGTVGFASTVSLRHARAWAAPRGSGFAGASACGSTSASPRAKSRSPSHPPVPPDGRSRSSPHAS